MPKLSNNDGLMSLDTEDTGCDFYHGSALPFFVTMTYEDKSQVWWEWDVDPFTRIPVVPREDLEEIARRIKQASLICGQNLKFDVHALDHLFRRFEVEWEWDWSKVRDTLIAGHLLASNQPHNLTSMVVQYLGRNIEKLELALKDDCREARELVQKRDFILKHGEWRIARTGLPEMPSAEPEDKKKDAKGYPKSSPWAFDMWLLRAIAQVEEYPKDHPYWTRLAQYSNTDSGCTLLLWLEMEKLIKERDYWNVFLESMKVAPVLKGIEDYGMTISPERTFELKDQFTEEAEECNAICVSLSEGNLERLPDGARSNALEKVIFETLSLKPSKLTDSGKGSMAAAQIEEWLLTLDNKSSGWHFVNNLQAYRKRKTALNFINSYEKFWVEDSEAYRRLHSSVNQTGTSTTRTSSSNPNSQQFAKKKIAVLGDLDSKGGKSARYMVGPATGREWWTMDYENIELRIPAYVSREKKLIELFERPNDPPFYGSQHLLNFSIVYSDIWEDAIKKFGIEEAGPWCRSERGYKTTWYQWCKNGDFAIQYNCGRKTADRTFRKDGSFDLLKSNFSLLESLNRRQIDMANSLGYIETLPDKEVDPDHGYPLLCQRGDYGKVVETIPLSYFVQGTAGWCGRKALVRCERKLQQWRNEGFDAWLILYVHDELGFDFPAGGQGNVWRAMELKALMEQSGQDIGVPLSVAVSYHPNNWAEEVHFEKVA